MRWFSFRVFFFFFTYISRHEATHDKNVSYIFSPDRLRSRKDSAMLQYNCYHYSRLHQYITHALYRIASHSSPASCVQSFNCIGIHSFPHKHTIASLNANHQSVLAHSLRAHQRTYLHSARFKPFIDTCRATFLSCLPTTWTSRGHPHRRRHLISIWFIADGASWNFPERGALIFTTGSALQRVSEWNKVQGWWYARGALLLLITNPRCDTDIFPRKLDALSALDSDRINIPWNVDHARPRPLHSVPLIEGTSIVTDQRNPNNTTLRVPPHDSSLVRAS